MLWKLIWANSMHGKLDRHASKLPAYRDIMKVGKCFE
jgi:hypothetical protein